MEFGLFAQLFVPKYEREVDPMAEHKRIMRNVEVGIAGDRAGFKYLWCPEHHFLDEYSHMPGPEVYMSYLAAQTENIHLGSAIFNITPKVNHPARVAETVALLDHITEGRFEFGTGRGSSTTEVFGFDIEKLEDTSSMWDETIREIPKMWKPGEYAYEGEWFRMPPREVFPKPFGGSHPAMWVAAGSPPTFGKAGSLGLGAFCFTHGTPKKIAPLIEAYKTAVAECTTPVGDYVNDNIMAVTNMICMEDREKAFEVAVNCGMNYYTSLQMHWLDNIPKPPNFPEWPDLIPEPSVDELKKAVEVGMVVVGDPDDCANAIRKWEDIGADQLTFSPTTNNLPTEVVVETMELFGKEVLPQFDKDPVHRTTRYRERGPGGTVLITFNFADLFEAVAQRVADRTAVVCGDRRLTYRQLDERSNRLARWMADRGIGPGDHVALYLVGGPEYFEAMLAAYKLRAVPINVNYRYVADELRHLFADAGVAGVIYEERFAAEVEAIRDDLPDVAWWLRLEAAGVADDPDLESALAGHDPDPLGIERSPDDHYVIYTGGTTGFPKGVVWRQEDAFHACIGGGDPMRLQGPVDEPDQVVDRIIDGTFVFLPVAPLMHAAGQWTSLSWLFAGGTVVLLPGPLDPLEVWRTVEREHVNLLTVVGDAVVRPLVDTWEADGPFDTSSLFSIGSGGAPLSGSLRHRLMELVPAVAVVDGFGSSETGAQGSQRLEAGTAPAGGVTRFTPYGETTTVLDEATRQPVEPGSDVVGRVALRGRIPLGYHGDPVRTAETFVEVGGHRWVLTGDMARREADGSITLLGRGSVCINTGGEKVHPEEVEAVLKAHPAVYDAVVVGVPDDRWGHRVAAVVAPVAGSAPTLDELRDHGRASLAGYKLPRSLTLVSRVERSPAGKPDYRWAGQVAGADGPPDA